MRIIVAYIRRTRASNAPDLLYVYSHIREVGRLVIISDEEDPHGVQLG